MQCWKQPTPLNRARAASLTKICPNMRASPHAADTEASGGRRQLLSVGKCGYEKGTKSFSSMGVERGQKDSQVQPQLKQLLEPDQHDPLGY